MSPPIIRPSSNRPPSNRPPSIHPNVIYRDNVRELVPLLPHLRIVSEDKVRTAFTGSPTCYDYDATSWRPLVEPDAFAAPKESTALRIVILEDLDPVKINYVGSAFHIGPGFFASHLRGSGYCPDEEHISNQRSTWSRLRPGKGQFSMSWLRPVLPLVPLTPQVRDELLNGQDSAPRLPCIFPECREGKYHGIRTHNNIFRRPVNLNSSLAGDMGAEFPVGWEERMSVWKGSLQGCNFCKSPGFDLL
jgi:hypothetical protein